MGQAIGRIKKIVLWKNVLGRPLIICLLGANVSIAELKPIDDQALSEVTGQAYVSVDKSYHPDASKNTSYTRINLGMDIEMQSNADVLELGRYEREGEEAGSADLLIHDYSLGYIYDQAYFDRNPDAPMQFKEDGSAYVDGEIVPFKITDPFLEFAYDEATNEMIGVRIGFGDAQGMLGGEIKYLTGNVNVNIEDTGEGLGDAETDGTLSDQIIVLLTPLLEGKKFISTKAQPVQGDPNKPNYGEPDPVRAEYLGVANGENFVLEDAGGFTRWSLLTLLGGGSSSNITLPGCTFWNCPSGDIIIETQGCKNLGIQTCFPLSQYQGFAVGEIGEQNGQRAVVGAAEGMFLSFQTQDLEWLTDVRAANPTPADFIKATSGAFFNIPNGAVTVNLNEAINGVEGMRREYIDRGVGLF